LGEFYHALTILDFSVETPKREIGIWSTFEHSGKNQHTFVELMKQESKMGILLCELLVDFDEAYRMPI